MQFTIRTSFFFDQVRFDPFQNEDGIQSHHWLTAIFLRFLGIIVDIKTSQGNLHLNKYKFEQWKKLKSQELGCQKECENVAPSKAIDILCAAQYTKKAEQELKKSTPAFSNAIQHLQKAISLQVLQKSFYERRVSDLKYLQQKWNDPSQPLTHATIEKLSQIIKDWKGKFPESFSTFPKLEKKITLLSSLIDDLKKRNPADLLNSLKEMPFADDRIKESIQFKDPLLDEMILQKNRVESEIAKNLMVKGQALALSKAASLLHDKAEILLLDAEIADRISMESTEAEKLKRTEAEQELSRRVKEQEEAEKQRRLAEEQERLRKEQASAEEEKQKKLAEEQEQAQRIEKAKAEKEKQEEEERKRIQQAKETALKLNNEAIECFNQMDMDGSINKLEAAIETAPDENEKNKFKNTMGAFKSLLDWCTQNAIAFKDVNTSLEASQKQLKEDIEKLKQIEIGPLSGPQAEENEALTKLKTIFEIYVKDCALEPEKWTTLQNVSKVIFKEEVETHDPVLEKVRSVLQKDPVIQVIKYNACKKMTKVCSDLYVKAVQLQFESHKQKAETKVKDAESEKKALAIEAKATEAFDKKDFALAIKLLGEAKDLHPRMDLKENLKKLIEKIEAWLKWMEEHQLKALECEAINKKQKELREKYATTFKNWSALINNSIPSSFQNRWDTLRELHTKFGNIPFINNSRSFMTEELLKTHKIPTNCLNGKGVLNNMKAPLERNTLVALYKAQLEYNESYVDHFLCAEFFKLHKELWEEIQKKKVAIEKATKFWDEGVKALEGFDLAVAHIKIKLASDHSPIEADKKTYVSYCTTIEKMQAWCAGYNIKLKDLPKLRKTLIENLNACHKSLKKIPIDSGGMLNENPFWTLLNRIQKELEDKLDYSENDARSWQIEEILTKLYENLAMEKIPHHGIYEISESEKLKHIPTKVQNYHFYNNLLILLRVFYQRGLQLQDIAEQRKIFNTLLMSGDLEKANAIYVQMKDMQDLNQLVKWKKEAGEGRKKEIETIVSMAWDESKKGKFLKRLIDQLSSIKVQVELSKNKWITQNPAKNTPSIHEVIKTYSEKLILLVGNLDGNEVKHPNTKEALKALLFEPLLCSYIPDLHALEGWDEPLHTLKTGNSYEEQCKEWIIPVYYLYRKGLVVESLSRNYQGILEAAVKFNNEQLVETNNHLYGSLKARVECSFYTTGFELFCKNTYFQFAFSQAAILTDVASLRKEIQESQGIENGSRAQECEKALAEIRKQLNQNSLTKAEGGQLVVERSVFFQKLQYYQNLKPYEKSSSEGLLALRAAVIAFLDLWFLVVMKVYLKLPENASKAHLEKGLAEWEKMSPIEQMSPRGTELKRMFKESFQI